MIINSAILILYLHSKYGTTNKIIDFVEQFLKLRHLIWLNQQLPIPIN